MIWLLFIAHLCLVNATVYDVTTIYRLLEFPVRVHEAPKEDDTGGIVHNRPLFDWKKEGWTDADSGSFGVTFPNTVTHELTLEANNFTQKMELPSGTFDVVTQNILDTVTFIFSTEELDSKADLLVLELRTTSVGPYYHLNEVRKAYRCIQGQMGHIMNLPDGLERNCDLVSKIVVRRTVSEFEDGQQFRTYLNVDQLSLQIVRNGFSNTTVFYLQHIIQLRDMKYLKVVANGNIVFSTPVLSLTEQLGTLSSPPLYLLHTAAICVIVTGYMDPRSGASLVVSAEYGTKPRVKLGVITAATSNDTLNPDSKALIRGIGKSWKIVYLVEPSENKDFKIHIEVDRLHDFPVLISDVTFCHESVQTEIHARTNARGLPFRMSNGTVIEPNTGFAFPSCNIYSGACSWTVLNLHGSVVTQSSYLDVDTVSAHSYFSENGLTDRKAFRGTLHASINTVQDSETSAVVILLDDGNNLLYINILTSDEASDSYITVMNCDRNDYGYTHSFFNRPTQRVRDVRLPDGSRIQCEDFFRDKLKVYFSSKVEMDLSVHHVTQGNLVLTVNGVTVVDKIIPQDWNFKYYQVGVENLMGSVNTSMMMAYTLKEDIGTMVSPVVQLSSSKLCVVVDYYVENGDNSTVDVTLSSVDSDVTLQKFMQNISKSTTTRLLPTDLKYESWTQDMIMFQVPQDEMHKSAQITLTATRGRKNTKVIIQRIAGCNAEEDEDVRIFPVTEEITNESPGFDVAVKDRTDFLSRSPCFNGGKKVLSEEKCICPAGFYGSKCESGCGANSYGADCGGRCSATDRECRGMLLCRPLLGCACAPALSGSTCDTPCLNGFYGSNCAQTCGQCTTDIIDEESACDRYSGECRHGCKPGFYAPLCKEKYTRISTAPVTVYQNSEFGVSINLENREGRGKPIFFQIQTRRPMPALTLQNDQTKNETMKTSIYDWQSTTPELISEAISSVIWRKISGLKPGRFYQLRVIFIDQDGGRYEGEDVPVIDIRTTCLVPMSANLMSLVSNITEDSFTITWNDVEEADDWCPVEKYEVRVMIGWQWVVRQYKPHVSQDTFRHLLPGRSYQVKLRTITASGATSFTDTLVATTSNARVLGRVTGLSVMSVSQSQITLYWTPPSNTQESSLVTYRVMYKCLQHLACNTTDCSNSSGQLDTTRPLATLSHLLPFSRYNITVFALSASTGVPASIQAATGRAAPGVPPMFSSKSVVMRTNSSITFEWNAPETCSGINGYLRGYHCQLFEEGNAAPVTEMSTETTKALFDGLTPHTKYTVTVYATTSSGWNVNYPLTITGMTRATTPAVVGNLTVYKRGRRMLGLRWSKPNLTYGTLSSFTLTAKQATGGEPISVRVEAKPCAVWPELYCHTLNNLNQDQEYEISVQARNTEVEEDGDAASVKGTTKEAAPTAPSYLKITKLTDTSVTIEWGLPSLINGQLRSFLINIEETDSVNASDCCQNFPMREVLVKTEEKSYHFELLELRPASTYMVSVTGKTVAPGPTVSRTVNTRPPTPTMLTAPRLATPTDQGTPIDQDTHIRVVMFPAEQYQDMISGYLLLLASNETSDSTADVNDAWLSQELSKISPKLFLAAERTQVQLDGGTTVEIARDEVAKKGRFGVVSVDSLSAGTYELVQVVVLGYCGSLSLAYVRGDKVIIN